MAIFERQWDSGSGVHSDFDAQVAFYDPGQTVTLFPVNVTTAVEVSGQSLPAGTGRNPVNDMPPPTPGEWVGGFIASAPGTLADALALDFAFPAGCFVVNRDGVYFGRPVRLEAEYRAVDDAGAPIGPWSTLFVAEPTFNTRKPVKFYQKVSVAPGRYEVRGRRYGAEAADFDVRTNGATGSTGATGANGAVLDIDDTSSTTPTIFWGKGFGDLPIGFLRPFAVTGTLAYAIRDKKLKVIGTDSDSGAPLFNNGISAQWSGELSLQ